MQNISKPLFLVALISVAGLSSAVDFSALGKSLANRPNLTLPKLEFGQQQSRALPSPLNSPPFPLSDWLGFYVIGEPDGAPIGSLQKAIFGKNWDKSRVKVYGYIDGSFNASTSKDSNFPMSYAIVPNKPELNQAVIRIEKQPDTVQTDHQDSGYRLTMLYGTDYRFTAGKGYFSNQLLKRNALYGFDPVEMFGMQYYPKVAQGMVVTFGRFISPPDIEAQLSSYNYMFSHSLMFTVDPYTFTGVNAMVRLSPYWSVLAGAHFGNDMAPWSGSAMLNGQLLARWVSKDNKDTFWGGINSLGSGKFRNDHDDLQHIVGTWGHKFNDKYHMMIEMYYEWQYDALKGGTVIDGPAEPWYTNVGAGTLLPGKSDATGLVNYIQYQIDDKSYLSFRNDYLNDPRGQRTGFGTAYSSHTISMGKYISKNTLIRPEIRYEHAYGSGVTPYDNGRRRDQWSISLDMIIKF